MKIQGYRLDPTIASNLIETKVLLATAEFFTIPTPPEGTAFIQCFLEGSPLVCTVDGVTEPDPLVKDSEDSTAQYFINTPVFLIESEEERRNWQAKVIDPKQGTIIKFEYYKQAN